MNFPPGKVLVIGATGKVGQAVVKLLQSRGIPVRVFVRSLSSVTTADRVGSATAATDFFTGTAGRAPLVVNDSQVEVCQGDVTDYQAVSHAIEGVVAIIDVHGVAPLRFSRLSDIWSDPLADPSHPASVNFKGVQNIVAACQAHGVNRMVRLTGMSVAMKASKPLVWLFCVLLSWTVKWHRRAEMLIRESGLNYTVVQPSGLKDFAAARERGDMLLLECEAASILPALVATSHWHFSSRRGVVVRRSFRAQWMQESNCSLRFFAEKQASSARFEGSKRLEPVDSLSQARHTDLDRPELRGVLTGWLHTCWHSVICSMLRHSKARV